jgi:predicted transcriptional regulator YheO
MHPKLQEYTIIANFLRQLLGSSYEVVLKDIVSPEKAVVQVSTPSISGKQIGDSLSSFALKLYYTRSYFSHDFLLHYPSHAKDQRLLQTSCLFIKDDQGELIGMLCVNFDHSRHQELAQAILDLAQPSSFEATFFLPQLHPIHPQLGDRINESSQEIIHQAIDDALRLRGINLLEITPTLRTKYLLQLSFEEKIVIVQNLKQRGLFLIKGSVAEVAKELHCSCPSIYRYLSKIHPDPPTFDKLTTKE